MAGAAPVAQAGAGPHATPHRYRTPAVPDPAVLRHLAALKAKAGSWHRLCWIFGLAGLFGAVNVPLAMANPSAAVVAAPANNLAVAAFMSSVWETRAKANPFRVGTAQYDRLRTLAQLMNLLLAEEADHDSGT